MRAALIEEIGSTPRVAEVEEPSREPGQALVEVAAAPLNPIDLSIGSGRFYGGSPETPYVPGREAVGRVLESDGVPAGTRVYAALAPGGRAGAIAERVAVEESRLIEVPDGPEDALAACLGVAGLAAWLPLEWRAKLERGETVLVLGASGAVGQIAIQAARLLGAGRVVAAARDAEGLGRARELGADATVNLSEEEDLAGAFAAAAEGDIDVTVDPLWGDPAVAAARASGTGARLVQIGQSAAPEATLASADVRGKSLSILGHSNFVAPPEVRAAAYRTMAEHAGAGRLTVDLEVLPLERVSEAWRRQKEHPHRKLVLAP